MAIDKIDTTPIQTRDELVAWLEAGIKPKSAFRVGTEYEKFAFTIEDHQPVPYQGERSIRALLEAMQNRLGWKPIVEGPNIIGLSDVTESRAISLEPGGQIELSGAPLEDAHQSWRELAAHMEQLHEVALSYDDPLYATCRHARPRYDVSDLQRPSESRLLFRSRHGEEISGQPFAAADRDGVVRQLTVHRRSAKRTSVISLRDLARYRF